MKNFCYSHVELTQYICINCNCTDRSLFKVASEKKHFYSSEREKKRARCIREHWCIAFQVFHVLNSSEIRAAPFSFTRPSSTERPALCAVTVHFPVISVRDAIEVRQNKPGIAEGRSRFRVYMYLQYSIHVNNAIHGLHKKKTISRIILAVDRLGVSVYKLVDP